MKVIIVVGFFLVLWLVFALMLKKIKNVTKFIYLSGSFTMTLVCLVMLGALYDGLFNKESPKTELVENKSTNNEVLVKSIVNRLGGYNVQTYCKLATVKPNFESCISTYSNDLFLNQVQSSIDEFVIGQIKSDNIKTQEEALRYAEERLKLNE